MAMSKRKGRRTNGGAPRDPAEEQTQPGLPAPVGNTALAAQGEDEVEVDEAATTALSAPAPLDAGDDPTVKGPAPLAAVPPAPPVSSAPPPTVLDRKAPKGRTGTLAERVADAAAAKLLLFDDLPEDERPRKDDRVLLLGLIWGGSTLIELEQVSSGEDLKVGKLFDLPASNLPKDFRLVQHQADELVVTIPAELHSEVHHSGGRQVDSFEQLSATGKARRVDAPFRGYAYTVQSDDRMVLQVAPQLTLIARYVRAARDTDKPFLDTVDWSFGSTLLVLLLGLLLVWLMLRIAPRLDDMLGDDLTRNQARFAKYQVKPPEEQKQPKFKDLSGVKEGKKAKDEEGRFGKKDAQKKEADPSKKGAPLVDPDKAEKDRKTVMKSGLLAALSKLGAGSQGAASNVLGPGGLGTGINNALGGVKGGAGQGDAYGVGGLGSRGTGSGGGGTALGIGGLGTGGDGRGRGGYGEVDLGGRGKDETQFIPGKTIVVGGLSREVISKVMQRHNNEIKYCYEKELSKDQGLYGKVTILFVIEPSGRVGDAVVQQTTMSSEPVESCILNKVKRWIFPSAQGQSQVTYPYVFKNSAE